MSRHATGRSWEKAARAYLAKRGLDILQERYRCRLGEIDLVCRDGETIVIVEVRARRSGSFASAIDSVDANKQRKIILATKHMLMRNPHWHSQPLRFDVIAVSDIDTATPSIQWLKNAFDTGSL
ncbi:MAG: YraN family protein [Candidatus Rariloculaceae bacterium]